MKSKVLVLLALTVVFGAMIITSCSDDKSTEPDDLELQRFMRSQVADDISAIVSGISYGYDQFYGYDSLSPDDFLGKVVAPANPLDSFFYEYANGWHIASLYQNSSLTINELSIDYDASITDSVQFRRGGTIVQIPGPSVDSVAFKIWMEMLLDIQLADTSLTMSIDNFHIDCAYQLQEEENEDTTIHSLTDTALVTGDIDFQYTIEAQQGGDHAIGTINYTIDVVDLRVAGSNGCPQSGSIAASLDINFEGPDSFANGHWTMLVGFVGESQMYVELTGPNSHFTYTGSYDCGGGIISAAPVQAFIADH